MATVATQVQLQCYVLLFQNPHLLFQQQILQIKLLYLGLLQLQMDHQLLHTKFSFNNTAQLSLHKSLFSAMGHFPL